MTTGKQLSPKTKKNSIPPVQHASYMCVIEISIERKTRLELATPTLARLCSTN